MITEERVMSLLANANPSPDDEPSTSIDAVTYLATLEQRSSAMTQQKNDEKAQRNGSLGTTGPDQSSTTLTYRSTVVAIAATLVVVVGLAVFILTRGDESPPVITEPPVTTLVVPTTAVPTTEPEASLDPQFDEALAVATDFMEARANGDFDAMADHAVEGHIHGFVVGNLERMPEEFAWQEAVGWTTEVGDCELTLAQLDNTQVECTVTHQNAISQALGQGPFDGSYTMKVMYEGDNKLGVDITETTVTEALFLRFPVSEFVNETWRPFTTWLEATHPADYQTMLGAEIGDNEIFRMLSSGWRLPTTTPESIDLWRQHVAEFVAEQSG